MPGRCFPALQLAFSSQKLKCRRNALSPSITAAYHRIILKLAIVILANHYNPPFRWNYPHDVRDRYMVPCFEYAMSEQFAKSARDLGGNAEMMRDIPFSPPDITEKEIEAVTEALRSGWITTGPKTKLFEERIAEYVGTERAVCLNSATAAMELTLRILGVGPGDEVITSAYTYTASASVIQHVGAEIVLVDTASNSFEMDYERLADAITEKTKVIIPVDLAGKMCDYEAIFDVVERKCHLFQPRNDIQRLFGRVIVMADAAHSFGARRKGLNCGQVADFTCYSFHAVKNLTTAEGGAVTWRGRDGLDHGELYKEFMLCSLHGQSKDALAKNHKGSWEYDIVYPAYKCNMTDLTAALGLAQLDRYEGLLQRRRELIELYDSLLRPAGIDTIEHYGEDFVSTGHLYLARIPGADEQQRNAIIVRMAEAGIATNVHFKPLPMFTAYKDLGFDIKDYPNAFRQFQNQITLPLHTKLSNEDAKYVADCLLHALHLEKVG